MANTISSRTIRFTGLSGFDTESIVEQLMEAEKVKVTKVQKEKQLLLWRQELYNDLNKDFANFIINTRKAFGITTTTSTGTLISKSYKSLSWVKKATSSNSSVATVSATSSAYDGTYKVNVKQLAEGVSLASANEITNVDENGKILDKDGNPLTELKFTIYDGQVDKEGKLIGFNIEVSNDNGITMQDVVNKINSSGANVKASYDSTNKRFFLQTKGTGESAQIKIEASQENEEIVDNFINGLNLTYSGKQVKATDLSDGLKGQNAIIDFNGAQGMTYSSNTITVNGITMNLTGTGEFTVTVGTDVDGIYEKIKNFVDEYNKLVDKASQLLTQKRYYNYEPLTDEQKKEMSEKEIELWEEKAKSGLLRNDNIISSTMQKIRTALYDKFNGAYDLISQIGITTEKYSSGSAGGKLTIDEEKLKKAISENPEAVMDLLFADGNSTEEKGIVTRIYDNLIDGMEDIIEKAGTGNNASLYRQVKSTILIDFVTRLGSRSYLDKSILDYEDKIDELNQKLLQKEEYYYSKFSSLETYISQMNSQSSWLSSLFSGSGY